MKLRNSTKNHSQISLSLLQLQQLVQREGNGPRQLDPLVPAVVMRPLDGKQFDLPPGAAAAAAALRRKRRRRLNPRLQSLAHYLVLARIDQLIVRRMRQHRQPAGRPPAHHTIPLIPHRRRRHGIPQRLLFPKRPLNDLLVRRDLQMIIPQRPQIIDARRPQDRLGPHRHRPAAEPEPEPEPSTPANDTIPTITMPITMPIPINQPIIGSGGLVTAERAHNRLKGQRGATAVPDEDVAVPEAVLALQEGQRGLHVGNVVWVARGAVFRGGGAVAVLRVVRVRAQAVVDGGEAGEVGVRRRGVGFRGREDGDRRRQVVQGRLRGVAPGAAVDAAGSHYCE